MTRVSFRVLFYIKRTKLLKDGSAPLFARITINNKRAEFGLHERVDPGLWNTEEGKAAGLTKLSKELNSHLDMIRANILLKKREMEEAGENVTAIGLRNVYLGNIEKCPTLLEIFRDHNKRCKELMNIDFAPGTVERYNVCYRHVEDFIQGYYQMNDIALNDIKPMFIGDFEHYLKTKRACAHNTAIKYIKNLKKIIRIALSNGYMKSNPFSNIRYKLDEVDMDFLNEEELNILMRKEFRMERLQQVKDVYLFCCFTGLAFIDVKTLDARDIINIDDKPWIRKKRQKTKNWCNVPLLPPAIKVVDKYKNYPLCQKTGKALPVLSNQKMNAYLKEIADLCGFNKNLSTHTARHTFATTVTLSNQISMEVVSKMLGHSSINMTKRYARVVDDLINKDMRKVYLKYSR